MKVLDIIKTANSNLFRSKLRTFLTLMAIIVGAFTLTLTLGIGEGAKDFINKQTKTFTIEDSLIVTAKSGSGGNPFASITEVQEYDPNQTQFGMTNLRNDDKAKILSVDGIEKAYPIYNVNTDYVQSKKDGKKYKISVGGLYPGLKPALAAGELPKDSEKNVIVIAKRFVEPLGYSNVNDAVGKDVTIALKNVTGEIKSVNLKISGVLVDTLLSGGSSYIPTTLEEELYKFQAGTNKELADQYAGFYAVTKPDLSTDKVNQIKKELDEKKYTAQTAEDQIKTIQNFITILQLILSVFSGIAILAATFGIVNTLFMGVYERTREIGLMKALGMKAGGIFSMFAFEALSIGFWGGIVGILFGVLLGRAVSSVASQTFLKGLEGYDLLIFPPQKMLYIVLGTMLIGLLAGTLPAIKAARLNPIDALRYE